MPSLRAPSHGDREVARLYSKGSIILVDGARCTMDEVELCVDVDP